MIRARGASSILLAATLAACVPHVQVPGPAVGEPVLTDQALIAADGARLPLHVWVPAGEAKAALVAVHGFNDYGNFIAEAATFLSKQGIWVYAYDQRGFGAAPDAGLWAGMEAMVDDLGTAVRLVRKRHPGVPVHVLGESMGGAVVGVAMVGKDPPEADGVILSAPAVWARRTQPWYQPVALWLAAHTVPWLKVTSKGIKRHPSDNIEMLQALWRDPLVIKETRIDAIFGLVDLMDAALDAAPNLDKPALILYGENDDIIPPGSAREMFRLLPSHPRHSRRIALYDKGYHMLLRDLQRETVWNDVLSWILDPAAPLPSRADTRAAKVLAGR